MRPPDDTYADALRRVIRARIQGDEATALTEMEKNRFVPPARRTEQWPSKSVIAKVFAQDHYQRRYCGERVILTPVMRLVSRLYPDQFPFHPYWKADSTHPAFNTRSATLDHVQPIAGGGDPLSLDNLVTACWGCNRRKGDLTLAELGWPLITPRDLDWHGLTELFRPLWEIAGRPRLSDDDRSWMRAVENAKMSRP